MSIHFCPRCNQPFTVNYGITDFIHICDSGNPALDNEDVLVIGDWTDFTGSGGTDGTPMNWQGTENNLWGTRAFHEGGEVEDKTPLGRDSSRWRQRQFQRYVDLTNVKKEIN